MSVQKILPIARKMGETNFSAYKEYVKNAKSLKPGESVRASLVLKDLNIVDTINFTPRAGEKIDTEGFRNLLREIYKKYFPKAADKDSTKTVSLYYEKNAEDSTNTIVEVQTNDKDFNGVGYTFFNFIKKGKEIALDIENRCEDFALYLKAKVNLKNADLKKKQNIDFGTVTELRRDIKISEKEKDMVFTLNDIPNEDVPVFDLQASISKEKLKDIFGGGLEQALPDLIEKSGMKF